MHVTLHAPHGGVRAGSARELVEAVLARLEPITLTELRDNALLERLDQKFVVPVDLVPGLIEAAAANYRALEVRKRRVFRYVTRYFDTPDLALYHAHHAGRRPRSKVRVREYRDTGDRYLELKQRTNTGFTVKSRIELDGYPELPIATLRDSATIAVPELAGELREVLQVSYARITLVHRSRPERVTIDLDLELTRGGRMARAERIAFIEVKQASRDAPPFIAALRARSIRRREVSKYCLGVINLVEGARTNRFRRRYARLVNSDGHDASTP